MIEEGTTDEAYGVALLCLGCDVDGHERRGIPVDQQRGPLIMAANEDISAYRIPKEQELNTSIGNKSFPVVSILPSSKTIVHQ